MIQKDSLGQDIFLIGRTSDGADGDGGRATDMSGLRLAEASCWQDTGAPLGETCSHRLGETYSISNNHANHAGAILN